MAIDRTDRMEVGIQDGDLVADQAIFADFHTFAGNYRAPVIEEGALANRQERPLVAGVQSDIAPSRQLGRSSTKRNAIADSDGACSRNKERDVACQPTGLQLRLLKRGSPIAAPLVETQRRSVLDLHKAFPKRANQAPTGSSHGSCLGKKLPLRIIPGD